MLSAAFSGCSRGIGDSCDTALMCSANATRLCDLTQPSGYCTLANCEDGTCPSESVCVTFWTQTDRSADEERLSVNYCMRKCDERSDCRDNEGYDCVSSSTFGTHHEVSIENHPGQKFCAAQSAPIAAVADAGAPLSSPDAGASMPDAGASGDEDAAVMSMP